MLADLLISDRTVIDIRKTLLHQHLNARVQFLNPTLLEFFDHIIVGTVLIVLLGNATADGIGSQAHVHSGVKHFLMSV